ncbi:MAG: Holliday junction resolvase RuvX [Chitinophagaceae bacterium]|nr:Holliday junction resolvase RuvX [Chitinophagaceae bacterium]MCW5905039.1 Holliday junction resolvase RuvX [Chitinophagaceae bacterium]
MARIMCIDYGAKRTGIAVTDPLQIIATALTTVATNELYTFLEQYFLQENVELVLIGEPLNLDDTATHATPLVYSFVEKFKKKFTAIPILLVDERFTSKMAAQAMIQMGMKKKNRQIKGNTDQIAATIMLQEYLENKH